MATLAFIGGVIAFGIVPMVAYALILWWFDRYEREPWLFLVAAFIWGFIPSVILAVIFGVSFEAPLSILLRPGSLPFALISSSIGAPLIEEAVKGFGLLTAYLVFRNEIDSVFDGVLYGSLIGFGFAALENMLYFSTTSGLGDLAGLALLRAVVFGLNHAMYTSFTGIGFALARFEKRQPLRYLYPLFGYLAAVLTHAIHNTGVTLASVNVAGFFLSVIADWLGVGFIFVVILVSLAREKHWVRQYLTDEVERGVLTQPQLELVGSSRARTRLRWGTLLRGDIPRWRRQGRFLHQATELAYTKREQSLLGGPGTAARVEALRAEITDLARGLSRA